MRPSSSSPPCGAPATPGAASAAGPPRGGGRFGRWAAPGRRSTTRTAAWAAPRYVALCALGQWVVAWLAIAAVLHALGLGGVGLGAAGVVLACITLAHTLPITPGGIGIVLGAACAIAETAPRTTKARAMRAFEVS